MSKWKLVKLDFKNNPAHFGELGIGMEETSERVRSDTLFSAIAIAYARLGKNLDTLLDCFQQESPPPFRLSSSFIYRQTGSEVTYYLPRPKQPPTNYPIGNDLKIAKDYKKLNFLDLKTWKSWYQDGGFDNAGLPKSSYSQCFAIEKHPKIAIDRITRSTNLYHTAFVRYRSETSDKSGLYFLVKFTDQSLEDDLKSVLELLGEEGLGGERSSGAGRFEPSWHDLDKQWEQLLSFDGGNSQSLISLYWDNKPISLDDSSYELQECGGWITSAARNQRRKKVTMFAEGSVFREVPIGKLADVTPHQFAPHKIYRSGIALSLPIKISLKEAL